IRHSVMTQFAMVAMIVTATLVCIGIMERGREIYEYLRETMEAKQDLLVKTTLMEKRVKLDGLTGLHNHMSFHEYLEELIKQSEACNLCLSLAVFDIDNFKKINDTWGHRVGDVVLERVSSQIQKLVGPDDFVARYGGEEFAVIFMEQTPEATHQLVERIREEIYRVHHSELNGQHVTISAGLNHYRKGMGKEQLFGGADSSLYVAKRTGKNRVVVFDGCLDQQA
ncbi:MAG TPA: GGDEF domain-containing protein, partial [Bacilli bacterium]|nr:GGDEF domain-containing protein [Bacilli bacterium]